MFEWALIGSNNEVVSILIGGGRLGEIQSLGRLFHLRKWFRQLRLSETVYWKECVHAARGFRIDERAQMGRCSSAHNIQRLTFMITDL